MPVKLSAVRRHGSRTSTGAGSTRSDSTVTPSTFPDLEPSLSSNLRSPLQPASSRYEDEFDHSPGSNPEGGLSSPFGNALIAPWDEEPQEGSAPSASFAGSAPGDPFNGFAYDGARNSQQGSPGKSFSRVRTSSHEPDLVDEDPRASSGTDSSQSSAKSPQGTRRKLHGFFGEEPPANTAGSTAGPSASQAHPGGRPQVGRLDSFNVPVDDGKVKPKSPGQSRPRTPQTSQPASEVTPWMFQDPEDIPHYGDAPIRQDETSRNDLSRQSVQKSSGKFQLHKGRAQKGVEEPFDPAWADDAASQHSGKQDSSLNLNILRRHTKQAGSADLKDSMGQRSSSTWNGSNNSPSASTKGHAEASGGKRSLFSKMRSKKKDDRGKSDAHTEVPETRSMNQTIRPPTSDPTSLDLIRTGSIIEDTGPRRPPPEKKAAPGPPKKDHLPRLPFKSKRANSTADFVAKDPNMVGADQSSALWKLDTDLNDMEGIVSAQQQLPPLTTAESRSAFPIEDGLKESLSGNQTDNAWDAPDSWAIKKIDDENLERLRELDENGEPPKDEDPGTPFCIRIFRVDLSFATLSVSLNTTVAEIINILGKKTFLQDDLDNYQIVMRRHGTSRQLKPNERPIVIQKKLLEQAGYNNTDNIAELGRDDHSYLCRFTFTPAKMSGFASLDQDPGFTKMNKFSNVDLENRSLITIPLLLYKKASEIQFLNVSRNISLDVPRDFISSCTNLREIRYVSNEAWRVPQSFSLATSLTFLDVSNNRLQQLEHAELDKLENLVSLKLANNQLSSLPEYFGNFRSLRSLNVSSNSLVECPPFLSNIKTLVELDISFNSISSIPQIGQLEKLEKLGATNNNLSGHFAQSVASCQSLREIDVRFNKIDNIDAMSQLPQLDSLLAGHNQITAFQGSFKKLRTLYLDHNPVTRFDLDGPVPTLSTLSLASAKLSYLKDDVFQKMPGLFKLILDKNHFTALSQSIGKLPKLDYLSVAKNGLAAVPPEIGWLSELRYLDVRENNISSLPSEIWFCRKLETLNLSTNVLDSFPKPSSTIPAGLDLPSADASPRIGPIPESPSSEEFDKMGEAGPRRMSQASGTFSNAGSSPANSHRKGSLTSLYAQNIPANLRKTPTLTRNNTETSLTPLSRVSTEGGMTPLSRKDSILMNRATFTFVGSLRYLYLADNRLSDDVFDQLQLLPELRLVNLAFNELYDIPPHTVRRWSNIQELYLSGNELSSLPAEDLEHISSLKVLHINCNKFQTLPSELAKIQKLAILDAGSNSLKYNVNNWPYDWNWNWNPKLRYLNLSGNKRLEIKPASAYSNKQDNNNMTDFTSLVSLRSLGLMDVTLMISSIPDESEDRRIRTSGSSVASMAYGIADSPGRHEHLSSIDIVVPQLEGHDDETLFGLFDGTPLSHGGSKLVKYLQENFVPTFKEELRRKQDGENAMEPLRRTYLTLNKQLASLGMQTPETKERRNIQSLQKAGGPQTLTQDDLQSGCSATVVYLHGMDLFVSNVGNVEALLVSSEGGYKMITVKHDPASTGERQRIKEAGGFVSRNGKLNDKLDVSRAFGFIDHTPCVTASPHISQIQIQESDEIILIASRDLWTYLTPDFVVDLARFERTDLMRAAQKLRDIAIAFGASGKLTVMMLGVSDLKKKERARYRTHSMSMGPSGLPDEYNPAQRRGKRGRDATRDSKLARLDQEVDAPTGDVSLVFTDIKSSTLMWETFPIAMRAAIKMHNEVMRRHLRLIGGYEVKTEGDAFMVSFPTVTSALLWCFTIQSQLLDIPWPQEILNSSNGSELLDDEGNVLYRGLSVRMGIHWGQPVCETDPVTRRMDYFGPMVNRAARISAVADGGQITVSSDFIAEVQRLLETHIESDRSSSFGSEDQMNEDTMNYNIRRELRSLSSHGFEVKDLGERRLKGLENPEYIYLMYPHSLSGRIALQLKREEAEKSAADTAGAKTKDSQLTIDVENVWDLWAVSLRLEMLCSFLEGANETELRAPETALLEKTREKGGEITDQFLVNFVEHQIARIETCINTLVLRNIVRPFRNGIQQQAGPMSDIFRELTDQLNELQIWKEQNELLMSPS